MGGEIGVESVPGEGSTFWFTLSLPLAAAPEPLSQTELAGVRVLLVENHKVNRHVLSGQIASFGMQVESAVDEGRALELLRNAHGTSRSYQLVVLDYLMPVMDGKQLATAILEDPMLSSIPLVLLTSTGQKGDAQRFKEAGFAAYLTKPVLTDTLRQTLAGVLGIKERDNQEAPLITRHTVAEARKVVESETQLFNGHILLAEDNAVNQKVAVTMLKKLGLEIDTTADGKQALEYLEKSTCDLILMDCQMPEMDGYETTRSIRSREQEQGGHVPIIALTANAMESDRKKCLDAGMDDYMTKPFKQAELTEALRRWLPLPAGKGGGETVNGSVLSSTADRPESHPPGKGDGIRFLGESPPLLDITKLNDLREIMGADFDELIVTFLDDGKANLQIMPRAYM